MPSNHKIVAIEIVNAPMIVLVLMDDAAAVGSNADGDTADYNADIPL